MLDAETIEPAADVAVPPVDNFAALADLLAVVADPKASAARLAELHAATAAADKARSDLAAARERDKVAAAKRTAELDTRAVALLEAEAKLAKNMKLYGMRKTDLDQESRIVIKIVINARKYGETYQEQSVLQGLVRNAANAIGSGMGGTLIYDAAEVGRWELGPASLLYQQNMKGS
jgi:hypothetical protein